MKISNEDFLGRVINLGFQSYYFELCDICEKHPPNWIETNKIGDVSEVRVSCNDCHEAYISSKDEPVESINETDYAIYDEVPVENEDITPVERPAWMQEFIDEASESGAIETIGGHEEAESNLEMIEEDEPSEENSVLGINQEITHSEIESDSYEDSVDPSLPQIALWSGAFVKEALFGEDPLKWLEEQGAFQEVNLDNTIYTLSKMSENQVTNVKISAIHCLNGINRNNPNYKTQIIEALNNFVEDADEMVVNYALDTKNAIK